MATEIVSVTAEFQAFVAERLASGKYADAEQVLKAMRNALLVEEEDKLKTAWLEKALEEGEASGVFVGDPFESVRQEMGWKIEL